MSNWTPSIVPAGADQTVYLVLNDFGKRGRSYLETGEEAADLETVIQGMLKGEYSSPARIVAFNTAEGWARDVSEDVADEMRRRCNSRDGEIPANLQHFMEEHENRIDRKLRLV